jgi:hypothetical protein
MMATTSQAVNDASKKSHTARELAASARDNMERALGLGWHVVVGTDFSVELRYVRRPRLPLSPMLID